MSTARQPSKRRTWSRWEGKGRLPSEYEIVTHDLHYHVGKETPFEVAPEVHWNAWTKEYRDGSNLTCSNWNGFRDPDSVIYRTYVEMQDERETYVDGLLAEFDQLDHDAELSGDWVASLAEWYTPSRYVFHGLQMSAAYVTQLAPSSYITNAAGFQAADELRRVQRIAYRTRQLSLTYPGLGFGTNDRSIWEGAESWQPLRKVIEQLLIVKDWGEAFVLLNLVVKPMVDDAFGGIASSVARRNGDQLLSLIGDDLYLDCQRSRRWSTALANFLVIDTPANAAVLKKWAAEHTDDVRKAVVAALDPLANHGFSAAEADRALRDRHESFWQGITLDRADDDVPSGVNGHAPHA